MCIRRKWRCCALIFTQAKDNRDTVTSQIFTGLLGRGQRIAYLQGEEPTVVLKNGADQVRDVIKKFSSHFEQLSISEYIVSVTKKSSSTWRQAFRDLKIILQAL